MWCPSTRKIRSLESNLLFSQVRLSHRQQMAGMLKTQVLWVSTRVRSSSQPRHDLIHNA